MTGKQHAVLWLGVLLVIVRFFGTNQFSLVWKGSILKSDTPSSKGSTGGSNGSGSDPCKYLIGSAKTFCEQDSA